MGALQSQSDPQNEPVITATSTADNVAWIHTEKTGADLSNRVFIITGITHGIGQETARVLANYNATLVVGNRNNELAAEVVANLKAESENDKIHHFQLDLASLASVKKFAEEFLKLGLPLHGLVNNAGCGVKEFEETVDGIETSYQVNYLGPFFLTHLLMDKLVASAPSRVVNVSSTAHTWVKEELFRANTPMARDTWDGDQSYPAPKLCLVLHAERLNELYRERGVTAYSLHPGVIHTNIYKRVVWLEPIVWACDLVGITKSIGAGASTQVYCLLTDAALEHSGKFFQDNAVQTDASKLHALNSNKEVQEQVWNTSMRLVEEFLAKNENCTEVGGLISEEKNTNADAPDGDVQIHGGI